MGATRICRSWVPQIAFELFRAEAKTKELGQMKPSLSMVDHNMRKQSCDADRGIYPYCPERDRRE
jgi:hypothetical protein